MEMPGVKFISLGLNIKTLKALCLPKHQHIREDHILVIKRVVNQLQLKDQFAFIERNCKRIAVNFWEHLSK